MSSWEELHWLRFYVRSAPNMLIPSGLETSLNWGFLGFAFLGALYGGTHALAIF